VSSHDTSAFISGKLIQALKRSVSGRQSRLSIGLYCQPILLDDPRVLELLRAHRALIRGLDGCRQ
jgi:hypothetical protein